MLCFSIIAVIVNIHYSYKVLYINNNMIISNCIIFMVSLCASHMHGRASGSAMIGGGGGAIDCAEYASCTKCADQTLCSWSLERQNCVQPDELSDNLMVHVVTDCPQYAVAKQSWVKDAPYGYALTVSNDKKDFVAYLRRSNITCLAQSVYAKGRVDQNDVKCDPVKRPRADSQQYRQVIYFYHIRFNNSTLRLDNDWDYYVTNYDRECGPRRDDDCVTCTWTAGGYVNHFKRCSSANRCTGLYQFYDRRHAQNFTVAAAAVAAVPARCANATVLSAVPATAPWAGGTAVLVAVKNHRILAEKKTVTVTVAGRRCVGPRSADNDTIACVVAQPAPGEVPADRSAVVVEYGPRQRFSVESAAFAFRLVEPRPTDVSPNCGPLSGGTTLHIGGEHLDTGNGVGVVIGDGTECKVIDRRWDRITCVTGARAAPAGGDPVNVVFDNGTVRRAGREYFAYTADPTLDAAPPPLAGIAAGGTAVPVRGRHFSCARDATMAVRLRDGTVRRTGCRVHNDTFMVCRSPTLVPDDAPATAAAADDHSDAGTAAPIGAFQCDVRVAYNGTPAAFPLTGPGDSAAEYRLYADPVLDGGFETDGRAVTVYGRHLDWGYAWYRGDVVVELLTRDDSSAGLCDVTSVDRRRIVCSPSVASSVDLDAVRALNVTIGVSFGRVVHRRPARPDGEHVWLRSWTGGRTAVAVSAALSLLLCGGCAALLLLRRRLSADRYTHSVARTTLFELHPPESGRSGAIVM